MKHRFILYLLILNFSLAFTACKKENGKKNNEPAEPIKTEKGIAQGTATSKTIGTAGGELTTPDGKVKVIVPQGAVTTNTLFSIQPITNTLYPDDASRIAYRLLPEGTTFTKPIQLVFQYEETDLENTAEDLMTIAWQQANGTWKMEATTLNKQAKTLTVETTHFSDWVKTGGFELRVNKNVLKPNEKAKLNVVSASDEDLLAHLTISSEDEAILTALGNWKIIKGTGSLKATKSGSKGFEPYAEYTAPSSVSTIEQVEITMEVEGFNKIKDPSAPGGFRQTGKMILFANLLVSDNFMVGTLDGIEFGFFGNSVQAFQLQGINIIGTDGSGTISFGINGVGAGSYSCGLTNQPGKAGVSVSVDPKYYSSSYIECGQTGETKFSPSPVVISKWPAVGEPVEGSFSGPIYLNDGLCGARQVWLEARFNIARSR